MNTAKRCLCLNVWVLLVLEYTLIALDVGRHQAGVCLPNMYDQYDVSELSIRRD